MAAQEAASQLARPSRMNLHTSRAACTACATRPSPTASPHLHGVSEVVAEQSVPQERSKVGHRFPGHHPASHGSRQKRVVTKLPAGRGVWVLVGRGGEAEGRQPGQHPMQQLGLAWLSLAGAGLGSPKWQAIWSLCSASEQPPCHSSRCPLTLAPTSTTNRCSPAGPRHPFRPDKMLCLHAERVAVGQATNGLGQQSLPACLQLISKASLPRPADLATALPVCPQAGPPTRHNMLPSHPTLLTIPSCTRAQKERES